MTTRQQRRLEQKLARKAHKKDSKQQSQQPLAEVAENVTLPEPSGHDREFSERSTDPDPISEAKLAANRQNAQLSTGPVSLAGLEKVSQNATKHGLTGKFKVLPCESQSDFDQLLAGFLRSEAPVDDDEVEMVHQMAEALWLSRRCVRLQNDCFAALESGTAASAKGTDTRRQTGEECPQFSGDAFETAPVLRVGSEDQRVAQKSLALYMRYQTTQDRTFSRYATELRKRRNERARAERGFVSQKHKEAAERRRQELHSARQALQNTKHEAQKLRNRLTAAKAEALELINLSKKSKCFAAAA